jgi:hypothetical protein
LDSRIDGQTIVSAKPAHASARDRQDAALRRNFVDTMSIGVSKIQVTLGIKRHTPWGT